MRRESRDTPRARRKASIAGIGIESRDAPRARRYAARAEKGIESGESSPLSMRDAYFLATPHHRRATPTSKRHPTTDARRHLQATPQRRCAAADQHPPTDTHAHRHIRTRWASTVDLT